MSLRPVDLDDITPYQMSDALDVAKLVNHLR